jgi:hypothetical protein
VITTQLCNAPLASVRPLGGLLGTCTPDFDPPLGYVTEAASVQVRGQFRVAVPRTPSFQIYIPCFLKTWRSTTRCVCRSCRGAPLSRVVVSLEAGVHGVHGVQNLCFTWSEYLLDVPQAVPHVPQRPASEVAPQEPARLLRAPHRAHGRSSSLLSMLASQTAASGPSGTYVGS